MSRAVILLSGGVDSSTLLNYIIKTLAVDEVFAVSFIYGQKHSKELEMAKWQADKIGVQDHKIVDISVFSDLVAGATALTDPSIDVPELADITEEDRMQAITYVPNRNMMLLSMAAAYAEAVGAVDVYYGAQAQDEYGYWDCTADFIKKVNNVLGLNRKKPVKVHAPFVDKSKADVIKIGIELGVDYEHTWTCYRGLDKPCGNCPSCVERDQAFASLESEA